VTLQWDPSATTNVSYRIYSATGTAAFNPIMDVTATTAIVAGISTSAPTRLYVTAFNTGGESAPSNTVTNTPTVTPPPLGLTFEAESGIIVAPFYVVGGAVQQDVESTASTGGRASYVFTVTNAGSYTVSALVDAPNAGADSFYVNIDIEPVEADWWSVPNTVGFDMRGVRYSGETNDHRFKLSSGAHTLIVRGREAGCKVDRFVVATVEVTPPPQPPQPPTNLRTAAITASRIDLGWDETPSLVSVERAIVTPNFVQIGLVAPGNSFYIDTGLKRFTKYFYRVRAQNSVGFGPYSPIVSERTLKR